MEEQGDRELREDRKTNDDDFCVLNDGGQKECYMKIFLLVYSEVGETVSELASVVRGGP